MGKDLDVHTVFVRGVSHAVDENQLEEVFSDVGPLKKVILVRPKGQDKHKGFGFVTFSLKEDASTAVERLNGKDVGGKSLKLEIAEKRESKDKRLEKKSKSAPGAGKQDKLEADRDDEHQPSPEKRPKSQKVDEAKYQLRARTVAVGNLSDVTAKAVLERAKKAGQMVSVRFPVDDKELEREKIRQDGCPGQVAFVTYHRVKEAEEAVRELHWTPLPGRGGAEGGQKKAGRSGGDGELSQDDSVWCRQVGGEGSHIKKCRLIVRNLSFATSAAALRRIFSKAGFVWHVQIPRSPDGRSRGFAFVTFARLADAEAALKQLNETKVGGRAIAVDFAVAKSEYKGGKGEQEAARGEDSSMSEDDDKDDLEGDSEDEEALDDEGDDSEGEDEEGVESESEEESEGESEGEGVSQEGDDDEAEMLRRVAQKVVGEHDGEEENGEKDKKAEKEEERGTKNMQKEDRKPAKPGPSGAGELPRTVFVRGLHLDTTGVTLRARLAAFGDVASCRVVMDKTTGRSKGVAFVDFVSPEGASKAVAASERAKAGKGPAVTVDGAELTLAKALTQDGARDLAGMIEKDKEKRRDKDRRNLHLAAEGRIEQGSAAWEQMSEADRDKRMRAEKDKKLKLQSPNFVVSPTRLSIRNIPFTWDEKRLKEAAIEAVKRHALKAKPRVKQIKLLYEDNKKDKGGAPRSKGLGFVEFESHEDAVCALRELNNNPTIFSKDRRPIVEFAVENVKILKMREAKMKRKGAEEGPTGADKKKAKFEAWKEKKKALKAEKAGQKRQRDGQEGEESGPPSQKRQRSEEKREKKKTVVGSEAPGVDGGKGTVESKDKGKGKGKGKDKREMNKRKKGGNSKAENGADGEGVVGKGKVRAGADKSKNIVMANQAEGRRREKQRREEEDLDRMVEGVGGDGGGERRKRARKGGEADRLDSLVESYTAKLMGRGGKESGKGKEKGKGRGKEKERGGGGKGMADSFKRWFE